MKKIILILTLFIAYNSFAQSEKELKNTIGSSSVNLKDSGTLNFKFGFSTSPDSPIYNRVDDESVSFDSSHLCQTQGYLPEDESNCYYDVIKIIVTEGGDFDIVMTSTNLIDAQDTDDSFFSLYCDFNPGAPRENLIVANDDTDDADDDDSFMPAFYGISLPVGEYYLVVSTYDSFAYGNFEFEVRSTGDAEAILGGNLSAVPVNKWCIALIFLLIGGGIISKRFFF